MDMRRRGEAEAWHVHAHDVSLGGIAVRSPESVSIGQIVELRKPDEPTQVLGRVASVVDLPDTRGEVRLGVEFVDEDPLPVDTRP